MDQPMRDFTDLLLRNGVVGLDQIAEATTVARDGDISLSDALIQLGYAEPNAVYEALAEFHKLDFVDLQAIRIDDEVIQLVPESVARENSIIPFKDENEVLNVLVSDPFDLETIEKLRFILNRRVETALAPRESIQEAINRYYGQVEGESADSILQEFTDTQIDFTETTEDGVGGEDEFANEASAPIVRLVGLMIQEAVQLRASD
ncbi:MAG: type II/IV secretion system protein, partial [Planctomycetota bacterium]